MAKNFPAWQKNRDSERKINFMDITDMSIKQVQPNTTPFSAEDARILATASSSIINDITKRIHQEASEGRCQFTYLTVDLVGQVSAKIVETFRSLGYVVDFYHKKVAYPLFSEHDITIYRDEIAFVFKW